MIEISQSVEEIAKSNPRLTQNPIIICRYIWGSEAFIRPCIVNLFFMVLDYRVWQPFLMKMIAILAYHYRLCLFSVNETQFTCRFAWNLKIQKTHPLFQQRITLCMSQKWPLKNNSMLIYESVPNICSCRTNIIKNRQNQLKNKIK